MRFADVIGQEDVKHRLRLSVEENRIPHAMLFTSPSGVGALPLALAFAQYVECPHRVNGDSCGVCPSCLQMQKLQHPDLHFAFPVIKSDSGEIADAYVDLWRKQVLSTPYFDLDDWHLTLGAGNKQSTIYEKESSEILRKLSIKSFYDDYKIMLIWLPEKMNVTTANKLLKLLEEPPQKTLFLLVSEQPELLLSTILSRTQEIRVPRLSEDVIRQSLLERDATLDEETAEDISHIANGSLIKAYRALEGREQEQKFFNDFVCLMRWSWQVGNQRAYDALINLRKWSLEIADSKIGREQQKAFLQYAQRQVRENFIANYHLPNIRYQTQDERNFSTKFSPFINEQNVESLMQELEKAEIQISQNGNAKIIFFDLCLRIIVMFKK